MSISLSNDEKGAAIAPYNTTSIQCEEDGSEMEILDKKWQGTAADKYDMDTLGRVQELRVQTPSLYFNASFLNLVY